MFLVFQIQRRGEIVKEDIKPGKLVTVKTSNRMGIILAKENIPNNFLLGYTGEEIFTDSLFFILLLGQEYENEGYIIRLLNEDEFKIYSSDDLLDSVWQALSKFQIFINHFGGRCFNSFGIILHDDLRCLRNYLSGGEPYKSSRNIVLMELFRAGISLESKEVFFKKDNGFQHPYAKHDDVSSHPYVSCSDEGAS